MANRVLKLHHLIAKVSVKKTAIYQAIKEGTFPAPILIGKRAVGWLESDVDAWIESRPKAGCAALVKMKGAA